MNLYDLEKTLKNIYKNDAAKKQLIELEQLLSSFNFRYAVVKG